METYQKELKGKNKQVLREKRNIKLTNLGIGGWNISVIICLEYTVYI